MKKAFYFLTAVFFLVSCDSSKVFQKFENLPDNKWLRDNVVTFEVNIEDAAPAYNVELAIRHTTYYQWANLKLNLTTVYPSGEERTKDYEFFIRDTDGSFKGEGTGDLWDINFECINNVTFPEKGKYIFKVQNLMPMVETEDIMEIGLIVRKSK